MTSKLMLVILLVELLNNLVSIYDHTHSNCFKVVIIMKKFLSHSEDKTQFGFKYTQSMVCIKTNLRPCGEWDVDKLLFDS